MESKLTESQIQEEYKDIEKIIQTDPLFECIVNHVYEKIPENDLLNRIYECKSSPIASPSFANLVVGYIQHLTDESILNKLMTVGSNEWHYRLSKLGKYTLDKMIESGKIKYNHPKTSNGPTSV